MAEKKEVQLSDIEALLKKKFNKDEAKARVQSNAHAVKSSDRVDSLVIPDEMRARMPLTKDQFAVRENPHLVAWEREARKFLRNLTPNHGHRVSAVMIYEWATGIQVAELVSAGGNANRELRALNRILKWYFGTPYMTHIAGRKVPNCYKVKPGTYITRRRPMTITLYAEYLAGTLNP